MIAENHNERVLMVDTNEARNFKDGVVSPKAFSLRGKALLVGVGVLDTPEGLVRVCAIFPADAWAGSDFFHCGDFSYHEGQCPSLTSPIGMLLSEGDAGRLFGINPIVVPVSDCKPMDRNTLFIPEAVERWHKETPLELP